MSLLAPAGQESAAPGASSGAASAPAPIAPTGPTKGQLVAERLASLSSEPRNELAALALTGLGGALAIVSYFLPWANGIGLAIGTTGSQPQPGAWALDTPAGWPLLLITVLLLASVAAGDRAQELLPGLAPTIRRLTEVVAPLALGSGLLGVVVLYLTLPWGCGSGPYLLGLGACLLIAGSMVALFYPSSPRPADREAQES